mgnify:CR=1 FL=1
MVETEVRQPIEPSFEQKLLQGEVIFSTKLTLEELLPKRHPETKGLLDKAPVNFQAWALGDSFLYAASFSKNNSLLLISSFLISFIVFIFLIFYLC